MAHWAEVKEIDGKLIVQQVIRTTDGGDEGYSWLVKTFGTTWIKTSYNGSIRKNFAGIGLEYRQDIDAFVPSQPFPSWILNEETAKWEAPIPKPEVDGIEFMWVEGELSWVHADRDI